MAKVDQLVTQNRMLGVQLSRQTTFSSSKDKRQWPSQPQNPRKQCLTIIVRNGSQYEEPIKEKKPNIDIFNPSRQTILHE